MLRLSKLADYAAALLVRLGKRGELTTAVTLAHETGMPEPTVAKLLKALAANGLVVSYRGARGGYRLGEPLANISVARVIVAIDGPISITACCDGQECAHGEKCGLSGQWDMVNHAMRQVLEKISLAEMASQHRFEKPGLVENPGYENVGCEAGCACTGASGTKTQESCAQGSGVKTCQQQEATQAG